MRLQLLLFFLIVCCNINIAQAKFLPGTIYTNDRDKIDCLIKYDKNASNPGFLRYKLNGENKLRIIQKNAIKQFEITDVAKFQAYEVLIDRSSDATNSLSTSNEPTFSKELLLLKVVVDGSTKLYSYKQGNFRRFFYKKNKEEIQQLIYRSYLNKEKLKVVDYSFRSQLNNNINCSKQESEELAEVEYNENDLIDVFITENKCLNSDYQYYESKLDKPLFHFTIRPGVHFARTQLVTNIATKYQINYGNHQFFRIGTEIEIVEKNPKRKNAIFIEPCYTIINAVSPEGNSTIRQQSVYVPMGYRHYINLSDQSKIFANVSINLVEYNFTSHVILQNGTRIKIDHAPFYSFGLGFKFRDRFSFETRYNSNRDILNSHFLESNHQTVSLILGYSLI